MESFFFNGKISTTINILKSTHYIRLHEVNLILGREKMSLTTDTGINYLSNEYIYRYDSNILEIIFPYILIPGLYTLEIQFFGHLIENNASIYKNFYMGYRTALLLAPHIQATGIRQLFPCWDEPHLKATFNISIKHPRIYSVLSNMPINEQTYEGFTDSFRTSFYITPPMSTLQVAIVVTDYYQLIVNENITLWCDCYSVEQSNKFEFAREIINDITSHLKSEFSGINIPKMDHVAIPNFPQDGTSKWGLIFHTEANLLYDEKLHSVMRKMEVARLIAPKIAYQWFSNSLSSDWSNFWLLDALATMFGEEAVAKSFNYSEILNLFIIRNQYESLHLDSHFNMNPVEITSLSEINSIFSFPRYMKAIIVLRMFRSAISDQVFRIKILRYVSGQFGTIMSNNSWAKGEKLARAYFCPNTSSYEFSNWMYYKHYPVISWERDTNYIGYVLSRSDNTSNIKWLVPIKLMEISLNVYYKTCLASHINFIEMKFPQSDRWMVNLEQAGYYRVQYDLKGWHAIANYLNSTAGKYENISVINRAKIVDDAFHLMMERQLDVSLFCNLTQFLSQETNYVVWYPMIKVFEYMSTIFPISKDGIKFIDIKTKFRELLDKPVMAILLKEHLKNDFSESFKQEILKWSCTLKHIQCARMAKDTLGDHLQNPEIEPVSSEWKHWTYCRGFIFCYHDNYSMWFNARDIWLRKPDHDLLPFLACCEIDWIITGHLTNFFLNRFTQRERKDVAVIRFYINIFHSIVSKHANTYNVLQNILYNLEEIKPKETNLLYDEKLHSVMRKMEITRLIAPKIAYQWFSNSLSSDWSNFWLLDALATMFGEEAVAKSFNNSEILNLFIIHNQYESLHLDSPFNMNPVEVTSLSEINSIFSFPRYMKAIIILRMFQSAISDQVFRIKIRRYVSGKFGTTMFNNSWAKGEKLASAYFCLNRSLNEFSNWIHYKHYPVISWERYTNFIDLGFVLSHSYNTSNIKWLIPITLREISLNKNYTTCLASHINYITINFTQSDCWMVNIEQAGYYRIKYDSKGWHAIANYLNSTAGKYESISVINRAKIVDDAFHLMMERQLDVTLFLNLTQFLSQETNYVVWYPMIKVFEYMSTIFPFPEDEVKFIDIKMYIEILTFIIETLLGIRIQKLISLEYIGTSNIAVMLNILQQCCCTVLFVIKTFSDSRLNKLSVKKYKQLFKMYVLLCTMYFLNFLKNRRVPPEWKHWTYCIGLTLCYDNNYSLWAKAKAIWLRKPDLDLLPFLACCETDWIITEHLQHLFLNRFKNESEDVAVIRSYINIFHLIVSKYANTYLQKILLNLEEIKPNDSNIFFWDTIANLDQLIRKMEVTRLIALKIAYQWFSNSLSSAWSNFWLPDALATMFGEEAVAKSFNYSEILNLFIIRNQYESLHLDSHFNMNPVEITSLSEINSIFSFPRYMKAIIVLRMFRSAISDQVFRIKILRYVSGQFDTIMSNNSWAKGEKLAGAYICSNTSSHEFSNWMHYKHYPVISWERDTNYTFVLSRSDNTSNIKWLVPIKLREISLKENYTTCLASHINSITITFPQSDCWLVNIEQAGYYRIKYDSEGWHAIANYLNSTAGKYESISVINRAKIVDDAFHLMMERQLDVTLFLNLTQFLSQETNYVVWYPMIKVFEYMSTIFPFPEDEVKFIDIKAKFRELLDKPLMAILLKKHLMENDFTESFKQEILKWSCTLKHNQCAAIAEDTLGDHLQNPEINPVSSEWKHWTYCRGLLCYHADYSTWFDASDIWLRKRDHYLLPFLACCETDWIITEHLTNLLLNEFTQNEKEDVAVIRSHINIFHSIISKHVNTYNILQKILLKLQRIKPNIIFIIVITTLNDAEVNNFRIPEERLPDYVMSVHYTIKLTHMIYQCSDTYDIICEQILNYRSFPSTFLFYGETSTTINILQSTQYITMHTINLLITNRDTTLTSDNGIIYVLNKYKYASQTDILKFPLSYKLLPGLYTLKIEFFGHLSENHKGIYKHFYTGNRTVLLLASYIQANGIRQFFPCWDEPHFKATFNISIKHSHYYSALSNMPSKFMIYDRHSDLVRTYFYITPPMSTLQVAIVVTDYNELKIKDNITLWCNCYSKEQFMKFEFAQKIIYNITLHLKSEFSRVNIPKMDHVAIPNFLQDGTSKWGLIFHT
ncbi:Aminopeptidase N [Trachymyrmex cornetzi]|uniref:Aminopeptidase N n=1 Tax=Trachymyrmex cornetzi TaxID=471704 RepID=A0A195E3B8_9HYME|nr:Aminopeptidase N [Trachymyrmex cornetzi]